MQSLPPRPASSSRASFPRSGTCAPWLLLAIFAANHSAARAAPSSLPYLVHAASTPLRFATPASRKPSPEALARPASAATVTPAALLQIEAGALPNSSVNTPPSVEHEASPAAPSAPGLAQGLPAPEPILPDTYAPAPPVTVQDFLPFFLPAPRPTSRATYEIR
jgi:hypothetical protein